MLYSALVVEDDEKIAKLLQVYLESSNFKVTLANDGDLGWNLFQAEPPDVVILDLMLPGLDGWEICRRIRSCSEVPILMLTACGEIDERVNGLDMGADDYVTKPFGFREVVARAKAIIRRANKYLEPKNIIRVGPLVIDTEKHLVLSSGKPIGLTVTEFKILELLAAQPEQVFPRSKIVAHIMGANCEGYERALDAHIKNLRKKIESDPNQPEYIRTVHGIGYKFSGAADA